MADVDACRADVAESYLTRSEAIVDVLVITAAIGFGERTDRLGARTRDIETESDARGKINDPSSIGRASYVVQSGNLVCRWKRIVDVRLGETGELAVVRKRRHCGDPSFRVSSQGESVDGASRKDRVSIQEQHITLNHALQDAIHGPRKSEILFVSDEREQTSRCTFFYQRPDFSVRRAIVDDSDMSGDAGAFDLKSVETSLRCCIVPVDRDNDLHMISDSAYRRRCASIFGAVRRLQSICRREYCVGAHAIETKSHRLQSGAFDLDRNLGY